MKLETFFEKFELFADAPDAVQKVRGLILDLAIAGKLFESDNKDATDELPHRWRRMPLGEIAQFINGDRSKNYPSKRFRVENGVPFINAGHLKNGDVDLSEMDFISEEHFQRLGSGKVERGDVLYCLRGSLGKCAVVQSIARGAIASSLLILRPSGLVTSKALFLFLISPSGRKLIDEFDNGSAQPNLSASNVKKFMIPVPPLAEQERIVAKVDELMALCDRLEAQQEERQIRHAALARATLARFADVPTPANLNFLFHESYSISPADLRKAILTLAVQGKLISQRPDEEPAAHLVKRIAAQRERLAPGKRVKAARRIRELDENKCVHDIPESWTWCRLGDLVLEFRYGTSRKCHGDSDGVPVLRIPNIQCGRVDASDLKYTNMPSAEFEELRLQEGDLLLVRSNGSENLVGRSAVASSEDERFAYAGYLVRARIPVEEVSPAFLHIALSAQSVRDQIEGPIRTTSGVKNINTTELSNLVLPLPPFAEQGRIVAKVNELMVLVDQLEAQLTTALSTAEKLTAAIVAEHT